MMKKLLLMSAVSALALNAGAQYKVSKSAVEMNQGKQLNAVSQINLPTSLPSTSSSTPLPNGKATAGGSRTFNHLAYRELVNSKEEFAGAALNIWQDSIMRQYFTSSGLVAVNFSSVAQTWSLQDAFFNDGTNPDFEGLINVENSKPFTVDSVSINGFYLAGASRPASLVDTLEITVAVQSVGRTYYYLRSGNPWSSIYLASGRDTLWTSSPARVDSIRRAVAPYPETAASVKIKHPLTASDRVTEATGDFPVFKFKLPTTLNVPAGNKVVVSYTFRSSDTWTGADTVSSMTRFLPGFAYRPSGSETDVMDYTWYDGDMNMSHIMFSTDSSMYTSTHVIGGANTPSQWAFQYLLNTISVTCPTCELLTSVSINEKNIITSVAARPNPASSELNIPVVLSENGNVKVSIINMMGQVVASQDLGQVVAGQQANANFNVATIASGVYMYAVEANGQRVTNRVVVAH